MCALETSRSARAPTAFEKAARIRIANAGESPCSPCSIDSLTEVTGSDPGAGEMYEKGTRVYIEITAKR